MKKTLFYFSLILSSQLFGQINPVQNLTWDHYYDSDNYDNIFSLYWEEPEVPHDDIIGYNIYRNDELYRFQTEIGIGCYPQGGQYEDCVFLDYNDGNSFTGYVAAVYEDGIESDYISFEVGGVLLNIVEMKKGETKLYPNPVANILKFSGKLSHISLFDAKGIQVISVEKSVEELNVSNLPSGTYLLQAKTIFGHPFEKKFIKK